MKCSCIFVRKNPTSYGKTVYNCLYKIDVDQNVDIKT